MQRNVPNASALLLAFAALLLLATPALLAVRADPINPNLSWSFNAPPENATNTATFGVGDTIPGTSPLSLTPTVLPARSSLVHLP